MVMTIERPADTAEATTGVRAALRADELTTLLKMVSGFASTKGDRPVLGAVRVEVRGGTLRMVASNGYVMGVARLTIERTFGEGEALIRIGDVSALIKALPTGRVAANADVMIEIDGESVRWNVEGGGRFEYRAVGEKYPNYDALIPREQPEGTATWARVSPAYMELISKAAKTGGIRWLDSYMNKPGAPVLMSGTDGERLSFVALVMPMAGGQRADGDVSIPAVTAILAD